MIKLLILPSQSKTFLNLLFPKSQTNRDCSIESINIPLGLLNRADFKSPSTSPLFPLPAIVVTSPEQMNSEWREGEKRVKRGEEETHKIRSGKREF
jgi:hypothetical protein